MAQLGVGERGPWHEWYTRIRMEDSLGLPPKPALMDRQLRRIYITVIRQNWHILPETQIIELLGWNPERFAYTLKEDDFLYIKLGKIKPKCDELIYHSPTVDEQKKENWVRRSFSKTSGLHCFRRAKSRYILLGVK